MTKNFIADTGKGLETVDTGKAGIDTCKDFDTCEDEDVDTNKDADTVDCEHSICAIAPFKTGHHMAYRIFCHFGITVKSLIIMKNI